MNLWVRRSGLILLSALTFFSCEEELSTVGLPPENDLGIFFVDVPLNDKVSQIWVDNIYSRATGSIIVGSYQDEYFGHMEARSFTELTLPSENPGKNFSGTATLDSLVVETRIRGIYGSNVKNTLNKIEIYQLTDTIPVKDQTYTIASTQALGAKLAESEFYIYPDSLGLKFEDYVEDVQNLTPKDSSDRERLFDSNDEYIYRSAFQVNDTYALEFFNRLKNQDAAFSSAENFADYFNGMAFVSTVSNSAVLTYGVSDTRMVLYYSETDSQGNTSQEELVFGASATINYNNIEPNKNVGWSGSDFDDLSTFYEPYVTSTNLAYVQSGTNLLMKIDLSSMQQFADTIDSPVIQKAELIFSGIVDADENTPPPANMLYYLTTTDSLANKNYRVGTLLSNTGGTASVTYNSEDNEIRNDITLSLQNLLYEENYNQLILAPVRVINGAFLPTASSVSRLVVYKDNMHLRFYYSIPDKK
ncbi:DUF4270 domain-containing protein [Fulvivirga ulvae]|uniref:DUF4270 family protein n=1 Tax=Fulvivirga ulvae TaxID=2904245 RepID=UPI001F45862C|nr:DUF4270 family protein [Fulvivirga ulvae]UII34470.1 DUF4270 domain-containing protein [Fulvivirga ulvae]